MAEHNVQFDIPSGWGTVQDGQVGISSLFPNWVEFHSLQPMLQHHGLFAVEQLLSPDCSVLLSWVELCNQIPSLPGAVPKWFLRIEAALGLDRGVDHKCAITLPLGSHAAIPNPFCLSLLPFTPIKARVGDFVIAFPASFLDEGAFFLARLIGWEGGTGQGAVKYHLQHWQVAEEGDVPGGLFSEGGYYVQCRGECEGPQPCEVCGAGCCWWESSGVVSVASETWTGWIQLVNFMDEEVGGREFVCLELTQAEVECLWTQLPDEPGGPESPSLEEASLQCMSQQPGVQSGEPITVAGVPVPATLPPLLSLICPSSMRSAPAWLQLQRLSGLTVNADS